MDGQDWKRFAALGDSFTEGIGDPGKDGRDRGWADRVAAGLAEDDPELLYANLAIRGRKLAQIVSEQVPAAVALQPDLVTFSGGVNDALRRTWDLPYMADTLEDAIAQLRGTGADVMIVTFGRPRSRSPLIGSVEGRLSDYREVILDVADRYGCMVTDFWGIDTFADSRFWSEDRLHLNEVGHERVSLAVLEGLGHPKGPWAMPLPPVKEHTLLQKAARNASWMGKHLAPWMARRVTGRSSGDGVVPKRPELAPVNVPL